MVCDDTRRGVGGGLFTSDIKDDNESYGLGQMQEKTELSMLILKQQPPTKRWAALNSHKLPEYFRFTTERWDENHTMLQKQKQHIILYK